MQCKDIEDLPLLRFIADTQAANRLWVCVWDFEPPYSELPDKLFRAKMGQLIKRGLITGCNCGCRGDYQISDRGREYLAWDSAMEKLAGRANELDPS